MKSAGGGTCCFRFEPFGNLAGFIVIFDWFSLGPGFSEDDRGLKLGRLDSGARRLGRRGAGENDLFRGGGGEPEGVEWPEKRSSHILKGLPALGTVKKTSTTNLQIFRPPLTEERLPDGIRSTLAADGLCRAEALSVTHLTAALSGTYHYLSHLV